MSEWTSTGEPRRTVDLTEPNKLWQHPWQLSHRVRLHNKLKETALKQGAKLNLGCKVLAVDAAKGTVKLEDGSEVHADIIVGADGIYVSTRIQYETSILCCIVKNKSIVRLRAAEAISVRQSSIPIPHPEKRRRGRSSDRDAC